MTSIVRCMLLLLLLSAGFAPSAAETVQRWVSGQGTEVILVEDFRQPVIHLRLVFPAGRRSAWMRRGHGVEAFRIQLYDREGRLRKRADRLAADLRLDVGPRTSQLTMRCLAEDWDGALELARELLTETDIDRSELRRWNQQRKRSWSVSGKTPGFRARQAAARLLFQPEDPRRWPFEKPQQVERNLRSLVAMRDRILRLPGRRIGFAGAITRQAAEEAIRDLLPPVDTEVPVDLEPGYLPLQAVSTRPSRQEVTLRGLSQVTFAFGRESLPLNETDRPAFLVADHVLGGHFYSRLYEALRHDGGETYSARTADPQDVVVGSYRISTYTRTENADVVEAKLREVLRLFHEQGIHEEERAAALGFLSGRLPFGRQSPDQILARDLRERALGLSPGFLDAQVEQAARLDLETINEFIRRFYDPAAFYMIRVEPR